jgi:hypothetical protein
VLVTAGLGAEVDQRVGHGVSYFCNSVLKYLFTFHRARASYSPIDGHYPPCPSL